jgi:hypothetical protein
MARIAATGRVPVGCEPVAFEPVGFAPVGLAPVGLAPVGFEPVGFEPVALDPAGLDPTGLCAGSESAPQAAPVSDPTLRTMAGLPVPMLDGRIEAQAA